MAKHGIARLPVWNTEHGYLVQSKAGDVQPDRGGGVFGNVYAAEAAAGLMARAVVLSAATGMDRIHWYAWDNGRMGMVDANTGEPNALALAFGVVQGWLRGASMACAADGRQAWRCELSRDGRTAWLSWRTDGQPALALGSPGWVETLDGHRGHAPAGLVPDATGRVFLRTADARAW